MGNTIGALVGVFQAEQQAKAMQYNEKVTKMAAAQEKVRAARIAEEGWRKDQAAISEGRAQFGAAGVDVTEGSPLAWEIDSITQAAMTKATVLDEGEANAVNLRNQAKLYKWQAKQTRTMSYINVGVAVVADVATMGMGSMAGIGAGGGLLMSMAGSKAPQTSFPSGTNVPVGPVQRSPGSSIPRINER